MQVSLRIPVALSVVAATAIGGTASAQATTTSRTRTTVSYAATHNAMTWAIGAENLTASQVRVSGRYASAVITPRNHATDPAQVLLVRSGTRWVAKDLGTDGVGCGIVSQGVRTQLHLTGRC